MDTQTKTAELTVGQLTRMVRCEHPGTTTEGALFLINIRDTVVERLEFIAKPQGLAVSELQLSFDDYHSIINDIRESAPSVYTETMFQQFTDLGAWVVEYDLADVAGMSITDHAETILRVIATRLALRLVDHSVASLI